jgi:hypothetical protein
MHRPASPSQEGGTAADGNAVRPALVAEIALMTSVPPNSRSSALCPLRDEVDDQGFRPTYRNAIFCEARRDWVTLPQTSFR